MPGNEVPCNDDPLVAAIGIVIVTLACVCGLYVHFPIQEKVHDESADHLKEIYSQVNTFSMLVSDNWNHLSTWNTMLEDSAAHSPDGVAPFPATTPSRRASSSTRTGKNGFADFYFINSQGAHAPPTASRGTPNQANSSIS